MDLKKFIKDHDLSNFPIGLGGCRTLEHHFDSCDYDLMVFDETFLDKQIVEFENNLITLHHASLSETNTKKLLQYNKLNILQDDSWNLKILIAKISKKSDSLFFDFAKNSAVCRSPYRLFIATFFKAPSSTRGFLNIKDTPAALIILLLVILAEANIIGFSLFI